MTEQAIYITAELSAPARQLPLAINSSIPTVVVGFVAANAAYYVLLPWNMISITDSVAVVSFPTMFPISFIDSFPRPQSPACSAVPSA